MSKKSCIICYDKDTNNNLKCKICKNEVCDVCYANIVFNNEKFTFNFIEDKTEYNCPFCKHENLFSTTINNYNTNNKLIKLLIEKKIKDDVEFNNLVDDINFLRKHNYELQDELRKIKSNNHNLSTELIKLNHINHNLSTEVKSFKNMIEYKPSIEKLEKIEKIIKSTKKSTILFNKITEILNK